MRLHRQNPNVSEVLNSHNLQKIADIKLVSIIGLSIGANTCGTYQLQMPDSRVGFY